MMRSIKYSILFFLLCINTVLAQPIRMHWTPIDSLNQRLPHTVQVFAGINEEKPLRAWYVLVKKDTRSAKVNVVLADDIDGKESITDVALDEEACVAINGGYFNMKDNPATHVGLVQIDGILKAPATLLVQRDTLSYLTSRAGFGITEDGTITLGWLMSQDKKSYIRHEPIQNREGIPTPTENIAERDEWHVEDALAAGPMILRNGSIHPTIAAEIFFDTSIPNVHPRTALGKTLSGNLVLMIVDGRQEISKGVSLEELAALMQQVGAIDAVNLDGGGSSTLVVLNQLLNRPAGGTFQREVMSAITITCK